MNNRALRRALKKSGGSIIIIDGRETLDLPNPHGVSYEHIQFRRTDDGGLEFRALDYDDWPLTRDVEPWHNPTDWLIYNLFGHLHPDHPVLQALELSLETITRRAITAALQAERRRGRSVTKKRVTDRPTRTSAPAKPD